MNVRISPLLAVVALSLTGALLVGAGPASAAVTQASVDNAARDAATALVSRPDCFQALSPDGSLSPRADRNPIAVLRDVPRRIAGPLPEDPGAVASVFRSDNGRGTAAREIAVHPAFETVSYDAFRFFDPLVFRLTRAVTTEDMRTLAILHEVAHLTGALPGERDLGPLPPDFPPGFPQNGQAFNTKILVYCLGAAEFLASRPPVRVGASCHKIYSIGAHRIICNAGWSGGTDPVFLSWRSDSHVVGPTGPLTGGQAQESLHCSFNTHTVTVKLTDARGWQAQVTVPDGCPVY